MIEWVIFEKIMFNMLFYKFEVGIFNIGGVIVLVFVIDYFKQFDCNFLVVYE